MKEQHIFSKNSTYQLIEVLKTNRNKRYRQNVSWWKEYAASMKQSKTDGQSVPWFIARNSFPAGQRI